jgi:hypothetical protein
MTVVRAKSTKPGERSILYRPDFAHDISEPVDAGHMTTLREAARKRDLAWQRLAELTDSMRHELRQRATGALLQRHKEMVANRPY